MPGHTGENEELLELRAQVAEYERIFASAAPRLAAFKRLEEIARERKTVPEAVAAEAAMEVVKREQQDVERRSLRVAATRDALEGEVSMLLEKKKAAIEALRQLKVEHDDVHQEVGEMLDELNLLRGDAAGLMSERSELELHVRALELELAHLEKRQASALSAEAAVEGLAPTHGNPERGQPAGPGEPPAFELEAAEEHEESRLFDEFFHANVEHDKARDWILG